MRVVADTANGMGGLVVPAVFERIPASSSRSCTASSTGRSRTTRPTRCSRRTSATCRPGSRAGGFDVGLAFDGDADRVFVVDEHGVGLSGSTTTAMLAAAVLRTNPGATVLHNLICSQGRARGRSASTAACPIRTKVGHSFIKR